MTQGDLAKRDMIQVFGAGSGGGGGPAAGGGAGVAATGPTRAAGLAWAAAGAAGFEESSARASMLPNPNTRVTPQALFRATCHLSRAKTLSTRITSTNTASATATPNQGIEPKNR